MGWRDATPLDDPPAPAQGGWQSATPLDQSAPPAAGQDLGTTAVWNKPANVSWGDYMLAHLAKPFQGANQAAQDYSRTAVDAATFGLGDRLQSALTGNPLEQERAATAAASGRLGAMAPIVDAATYAIGPGELGLAAKIGGKVAPAVGRWAGGVLGAAAEGAAAGAAGAAGHDEGIGHGALVGGALGAAGGLPGGVVGRGGAIAPPVAADDLRAAAKQAYDPLSNILYDATREVHPSIDPLGAQNAMRDRSGYKWRDASKTRAEINTLLNRPQLSANDLQQSQSYLKRIAGDGRSDPNDALYAAHYAGKLQDVLDNATPQTGVPQNWANPTGAPSFASAKKAEGDALHGKAQDVERLNDWIAKSAVAGGPDVGGQASAYLRTKPGQTFAAPGTPQYDALNNLAKTNAGPDLTGAPSAWDVRHSLHPLVSGAAAGLLTGAGGQVAEGHFDPLHLAGEAAAGALLGYGVHKSVPWASKRFFQAPAQQRAIDAAGSTLSTGQFQAPVLPDAALRDAMRTLIFGRGAAGRF